MTDIDNEVRDRMDIADMRGWMETALHALGQLRSGALRLDGTGDEATLAAIYTGINDLTVRLLPRLNGIVDALVRAHYEAGGSHGQLAMAMDVERSTAQSRGDKVRRTVPPSVWERWATGDAMPQVRTAVEVRPGWTLVVADDYVQVAEVRAYGGGRVEIACGPTTYAHDAADEVVVVPREVPTAVTTGAERIGDIRHEITVYRRA